uniref:disease resistance protein RUN1-like n=1 Tax=Erigeron canadensis TaxID=72917 RepID=UPI001CB93DC0|nr:disease resistance protein RUN1-like [Erigeron canadensis]
MEDINRRHKEYMERRAKQDNEIMRYEAKAIKDIVDKVHDRLYPLILDVDEDLVGMTPRIQVLKSLLEIGSGAVRMVGIWGVGGGGKTTLATSVCMEISPHFDGYYVVDNIREEVSRYGLKKLQEKLLYTVLKTKVKVQSVAQGKHMIKSILCHRNVLILLDDVDGLDQLQALAGSFKWFGDGSRVIITTRDEHLLRTHRVNHVSHVTLLSVEESIQLFYTHAYNETEPLADYEELSLRVVSYAAGLPLALKVLGSFLFDKDGNEWRSALAKLQDIPDVKIMNILKISYDGLEDYQKRLFLHIACFFRWESIDNVMGMLEASGSHPVIGIRVLRQKALISIADGRFDMHDLVQEMGHFIVREEHPNNLEKHSRFRKYKDFCNMCFGGASLLKKNDKVEAMQNGCCSHYQSSCFSKIISCKKKLRSASMSKYDNTNMISKYDNTNMSNDDDTSMSKYDNTNMSKYDNTNMSKYDDTSMSVLYMSQFDNIREIIKPKF